MNVLEKVTFTWVSAWVLMDSLLPQAKYADKLEATIITTLSIAYLYGLHSLIYRKIREFLIK